jgi:hypothetical protein
MSITLRPMKASTRLVPSREKPQPIHVVRTAIDTETCKWHAFTSHRSPPADDVGLTSALGHGSSRRILQHPVAPATPCHHCTTITAATSSTRKDRQQYRRYQPLTEIERGGFWHLAAFGAGGSTTLSVTDNSLGARGDVLTIVTVGRIAGRIAFYFWTRAPLGL